MSRAIAIRLATTFYSLHGLPKLRCVVTEREGPHWHHLDENTKNWDYRNIVPLDASLNSSYETRRNKKIEFELEPSQLESIGYKHYKAGYYAQGYACARIGSFLMSPPTHRKDIPLTFRLDPSKSLVFASLALLQLRAISALPLAIDTLQRNIIPILENSLDKKNNITKHAASRVLIEIGSYYRDFACPEEALNCCNVADNLLSDLNNVETEKSRLIQHRGITLSGMGDIDVGLKHLDKSIENENSSYRITEGYGNYLLWRARLELATLKPNFDYCDKLIKDIISLQKKGVISMWTFAEGIWTSAEIDFRNNRKSKSMEKLEYGNSLFLRSGIIPTAVLPIESTLNFKERYPKDMFIIPRNPYNLRLFHEDAQKVISLIRKLNQFKKLSTP